jgi:hypothetical protein
VFFAFLVVNDPFCHEGHEAHEGDPVEMPMAIRRQP